MDASGKDKNEIELSRTTTDLINFSTSELIKRGIDLTQLALTHTPIIRTEKILWSFWQNGFPKYYDELNIDMFRALAGQELARVTSDNKKLILKLTEILEKRRTKDGYIRLNTLYAIGLAGEKEFAASKITEFLLLMPNDIPKGVEESIHEIYRDGFNFGLNILAKIRYISNEIEIKLETLAQVQSPIIDPWRVRFTVEYLHSPANTEVPGVIDLDFIPSRSGIINEFQRWHETPYTILNPVSEETFIAHAIDLANPESDYECVYYLNFLAAKYLCCFQQTRKQGLELYLGLLSNWQDEAAEIKAWWGLNCAAILGYDKEIVEILLSTSEKPDTNPHIKLACCEAVLMILGKYQ